MVLFVSLHQRKLPMEKIKIIVCCHKDDIKASSDVYLPLHVGKAISNKELNITCDNDGENISAKNLSYCEVTGLYWAWKNLKDVDYIGLCHYRRYFDFHGIGRRLFPISTLPTEAFVSTDLSLTTEVLDLLHRGYIILPQEWNLRTSVYLNYCEIHYSHDFRVMGDVINELSPEKYADAFRATMINSNRLIPFNMFIMSRCQFNKYCEWLFFILKEIEQRIDITNYDPEQRRIFGYMGERMLNIYLRAEGLKYKQFPILLFSEEQRLFDMPFYQYKARCLMNDLALWLTKY